MTLGTYPAINVSEQDLAERLARALEATAEVINARPVQLIEALPVNQQVSEAPDHSGPFTQNSKHRFKKF
jgi:hypothetical protein